LKKTGESKQMKKVIALSMVLMMGLFAIGCGGDAATETAPAETPAAETPAAEAPAAEAPAADAPAADAGAEKK